MNSVNVARCEPKPANVRLSNLISATAKLAEITVVDNYTVTLEPGHGFNISDLFALVTQPDGPELFLGRVLLITVNTVTLDTPINFPFIPEYTLVLRSTGDMNIDGSSTPVIFGITNINTVSVKIIRLIFHMTDATAMDDGRFGGLPALTRGIVFRKRQANGNYTNYWNVKSNGRFAELTFSTRYADRAPAGVYGFTSRLAYGGEDKHGVPIVLRQNEALQLIIQDDLTGLLSFTATAQGHISLE